MPAELNRRTPVRDVALPLLGGVSQDGLDGMLPGGVYAVVPQAPPARYALWARFLPEATRSGRICHVLTRSDPSDFLHRVRQSGWPEAQAAWKSEALRIYAMADGFAKLLFRRDVSGLTNELAHWGVTRQHVLLIDAADALLSLHDLSLATAQLVKLRAWAKDMQISVVLNFSLAGAGVERAELTSLMDHFAGLARLYADEAGPVITLEYWQSEIGTSAERTYLLQDDGTAYSLRLPVERSKFTASGEVGQNRSTAAGAVSVLNVTNDHVWAQELQMLTQSNWATFGTVADILDTAADGGRVVAVMRFDAHSSLGAVAKDVHSLRANLGSRVRIVVAEHRVSLRYANELVLLRLGADTVIRKDVDLARWPNVLSGLDAHAPPRQVDTDVDVALANAAMPLGHGFLSVKVFLDEVAAAVERGALLGVPFALGVCKVRSDRAIGDAVSRAQFRRNGDFLTTDGEKLYLLFNACSLTRGAAVLESIFSENSSEYLTTADWMASQLDIQKCADGLKARYHAHPFDIDRWSTDRPALPRAEAKAAPADVEALPYPNSVEQVPVGYQDVPPAAFAQQDVVPAVVGERVSMVMARTFETENLNLSAPIEAEHDLSHVGNLTDPVASNSVSSMSSAHASSPLRRLVSLATDAQHVVQANAARGQD